MIYLSKNDIIEINKKITSRYGGLFLCNDNIKVEGGIEFIVDSIDGEMFGTEMYPGVHTKAACYIRNIICNHIFHDGNKRTGLECALLFLEKNNYIINYNTPNSDLLNLALSIANGEMDIESIADWFQSRIIKKW